MLETTHAHYGAKRNKATKRMKKIMPEDRPNHWAIRQWPRARPTSNVPSAEGGNHVGDGKV